MVFCIWYSVHWFTFSSFLGWQNFCSSQENLYAVEVNHKRNLSNLSHVNEVKTLFIVDISGCSGSLLL